MILELSLETSWEFRVLLSFSLPAEVAQDSTLILFLIKPQSLINKTPEFN